MRTPTIELLWWDGCPSTERVLAELRAMLAEAGIGETPVDRREIRTDEEAQATDFRGSPTILIDGEDVVAASPEEPIGLSCRIYRRRDGRISPTPDPEDMRVALDRALHPPTREQLR